MSMRLSFDTSNPAICDCPLTTSPKCTGSLCPSAKSHWNKVMRKPLISSGGSAGGYSSAAVSAAFLGAGGGGGSGTDSSTACGGGSGVAGDEGSETTSEVGPEVVDRRAFRIWRIG